MRGSAWVAVAVGFLFSGCVDTNTPASTTPEIVGTVLRPTETPLWYNPQTSPHPLFNFPTLSHPATGANVSRWWLPIPAIEVPAPIQGLEHVARAPPEIGAGQGMALFGSLAVVPGRTADVLDISDPKNPRVLSQIKESTRNVDFIAYPTGRLVAVFATGDAGVLPIWDVTNPADPDRLADVKPETGTHKVNVVPGTPIVYNANSNGGGLGPGGFIPVDRVGMPAGQTEIFDLTDPENPVLVKNWKNGYGCHHIYFYIDAATDYYRAICAGIEVTQLWDITDPRNPEVVATIPAHHGNPDLPSGAVTPLLFSHFAILNVDHTILIVGDESGGGPLPACDAYVETPAKTLSGPLGNVWFYDIRDEQNPKLMGWLSPSSALISNPPNPSEGAGAAFAGCTAHHGRLVPDPAGQRDLLVMPFYRGGVVLIDFTDAANPRIVDQWNDGTNTWEAWYYNGYVMTGDLARGFDVFKFV